MRAVVNGHLFSVDPGFYDSFLRKEIPDEPFEVAVLILTMFHKYPLGIGDAVLSKRIKAMIERWELVVVQKKTKFYNSILQKV